MDIKPETRLYETKGKVGSIGEMRDGYRTSGTVTSDKLIFPTNMTDKPNHIQSGMKFLIGKLQ